MLSYTHTRRPSRDLGLIVTAAQATEAQAEVRPHLNETMEARRERYENIPRQTDRPSGQGGLGRA